MSKRFGRNQKRAMRNKIQNQEKLLEHHIEIISSLNRDIRQLPEMNLYEVHCEALKKIEDPYYRGGLTIIVEMWSEKLKKNEKITVHDVEEYYEFVDFYKILKEGGMLVYIDRHDNDDTLGFYVEDYLIQDNIDATTYQFFSVIYDLDKMQLLDIEDNLNPVSELRC